jgi:hypothetical protein
MFHLSIVVAMQGDGSDQFKGLGDVQGYETDVIRVAYPSNCFADFWVPRRKQYLQIHPQCNAGRDKDPPRTQFMAIYP